MLFAQGAWTMSFVVNLGGFDALLVRPFSPLLQVLSSQIGMNGLGNCALGAGLLVGCRRRTWTSTGRPRPSRWDCCSW